MLCKTSDQLKIACFYVKILNVLRRKNYGKRKIFYSEDGTTNGLRNVLKKYPDEKFLIILSEIHKKDIPNIMEEEN